MTFGEKLRTIRKEKGITQEQLAERLGVSRQAVSKWESDQGYPETEKLLLLSKELGVSLDHLFDEQAEMVSVPEFPASEPAPEKPVSAAPSGVIAIRSFDGLQLVMCRSVRSSKILFAGKNGLKYVLGGVNGAGLFGDHSVVLGLYKTKEAVQKEIDEINEAMLRGEPTYELKYFTKVEWSKITGAPKVIE